MDEPEKEKPTFLSEIFTETGYDPVTADRNTVLATAMAILQKLKNGTDETGLLIVGDLLRTISETKAELQKERAFDQKTGLHSQNYFNNRLGYTIARMQRGSVERATLIAIDLDDFSQINNKYTHDAGDQALKAFADVLKKSIRITDVAARSNNAGDEFFVLFEHAEGEKISKNGNFHADAERLIENLKNVETEYKGHIIPIKCSMGIVHIDKDISRANTVEDLLHRADAAMYLNKQARKGGGYEAAYNQPPEPEA